MNSEWKQLNEEVLALMQDGRLEEALVPARAAVESARKEKGEDHPDHALSLNNLGELCHILGAFDQAEAAMAQSLQVYETALGPKSEAKPR